MDNLFETNKEDFLTFFDTLKIGVLIHREKILYANEHLLKLYGLTSLEEARKKLTSDFVSSEYQEMHRSNLNAIMNGKNLPHFVEKTFDVYGNVKWIEGVTTKVLFNGEEAMLVFLTDVTERVENEKRLSQIYRLDLIRGIAELMRKENSVGSIGKEAYEYCKEHGIADYMYIATVRDDVIEIESAFLKDAAIVKKELQRNKDKGVLWYVVENGRELYLPNVFDFDVEGYKLVRISSLSTNVPFSYFAIPIKREEKVEMVVVFLKNGYDSFSEVDFTFFNAITSQIEIAIEFNKIMNELKKEREKFRNLAMDDALTGVYTRHFFNEWMENYYEIVKRKNEYASLVMIDIDHFKKINDTYGHLTGDEVLKSVGKILKESVRKMDLVVRYGGDEFLVIFPQTPQKKVELIMERINAKIARLKKGFGFNITISYGSAYISPEIDYRKALKVADEKMYEMKNEKA